MSHPLIVHNQCLGEGCPECNGTGQVEFFLEPPTPTPYYCKYFLNDEESGELYTERFISLKAAESWLIEQKGSIEVFYRNF